MNNYDKLMDQERERESERADLKEAMQDHANIHLDFVTHKMNDEVHCEY